LTEDEAAGAGLSGAAMMARTVSSAGVVDEADSSDFPDESAIVPRKKDVTATSRYRGGWLDGFMTISCLTDRYLKLRSRSCLFWNLA
jgi:hypothetical protein